MPNVFISHRGSDVVLAEKLATEVRAAGHAVWLDAWEIGVGDQIVEKMNHGLHGASYVIICYSSSGMADWMNIEWFSALARQLNGEGIKVLPARLSGRDAPAILRGTKYADLMLNWDKGVEALLKAMR